MKKIKRWFRHMNKKKLSLLITVTVIVLASVGVGIYFLLKNPDEVQKIIKKKKPEPEVQIVDLKSKSRPYAVMINNIDAARTVQSGLNKAYMVYEIIVEGGITRYMALFRDVDEVTLGSVRSSRHYYLDYVLENDAIYAHWGYSDQAKSDISALGINNINGLTYEGRYFYRTNIIGSPHNGFTNMDLLKKGAKAIGYDTKTDKGLLLNYSAKNVNLKKHGDVKVADEVDLVYSRSYGATYIYDKENKVYDRYVNGQKLIDHETDTPVTVKNIIVYQINNFDLNDGSGKGRQGLDNIGTGEGYFISNGKAIKINWEKTSRASKTKYTFEDGKELKVNDGNTWIQIVPTIGSVDIIQNEITSEEK